VVRKPGRKRKKKKKKKKEDQNNGVRSGVVWKVKERGGSERVEGAEKGSIENPFCARRIKRKRGKKTWGRDPGRREKTEQGRGSQIRTEREKEKERERIKDAFGGHSSSGSGGGDFLLKTSEKRGKGLGPAKG